MDTSILAPSRAPRPKRSGGVGGPGFPRPGWLAMTALGLFALFPMDLGAQNVEEGRVVYDRWCASCHGFEGDGRGPAAEYMLPRPRDFTRGLYQIRTTPGGELPTDADILHIINVGMPGTTMPGWQDQLSRRDRDALVAYVKSFYPLFETMGEPEPMSFGRAPRSSDERIAEGRTLFQEFECWQCHGAAGRGDGTSAPELEDDWGYPTRPADLTQNWRFTGGGSVQDIYRTILTGLDGTPMPQSADLLDAGYTEDQMWSLAHYVRSLSPERTPRVREVIRVERAEPGEVPGSVQDERWDEVERFFIPLVGQIMISPRWFDPAVKSVWVQGVHDGDELALRLTWSDRSRSPDPVWTTDWQARVLEAMEPKEGPEVEPGPRPDRFTVQFPPTIPEGMDRPFFLMGDARNPVYQWRWSSDAPGAERATARGMLDVVPLGAGGLTAEAVWEEGQWQLLLRRSLESPEGTGALDFEVGRAIPVAFFAWDGDHGEDGTRGSVSSWFFVHLEEETPPSTYVTPLVAFLLTGGLGLLVVGRAQRREREGHGGTPEPMSPAVAGT